jgi:XTP/dITP diphosphohydrolase
VLVLARAGEVLASFDGVCEGAITLAPKGTHGFGYDPLFIPTGYARTFGQLTERTKTNLSHRGRALKKFLTWLRENPPV